jgi:hypothetical protein
VQAARKNVQSTAELMAQLSEQLPQHIGQILDIGAATTTTANLLKEQQQILAAESVSPFFVLLNIKLIF